MKKLLLLLLLLIGFCAKAQPYFPGDGTFFSHKTLARIDILINPDSLAVIYKSGNEWSDHEFPATFIYHTDSANITLADTLQQVGFCLRGNTSRYAAKKSFKVSFNTFVSGRKFYGLEKLHLNGEHNDPCIMRTDLYWKTLASMQVPGSRANHVNLYINDKFYGVYMNVENYDEIFAQSRFGNSDGNLYKCLYPANLAYINNNPTSYIIPETHWLVYQLETNTAANDYSDLAHLIDVINNTPDSTFICQLEKVFNLNSFLRVYAVEIAAGNWDDYVYNENNFYLYHNTQTGLFEFIPYDVDNTFGVDFLGVDWGKINIYKWYDASNQMPLVKRLLTYPAIKNRLSYFINQLQSRLADTTNINPYIDSTETLISPSAKLDSFRTLDYGYTYAQFLQAFTHPLNDGHTNYGLKQFIQVRHDNTASQLQLAGVPPLLSGPQINPLAPFPGDTVWVSTQIESNNAIQSARLIYNVNLSASNALTMLDDGLHHDGAAGDGTYGAALPPGMLNDSIHFTIKVTDAINNVSTLPECDFYSIKFTGGPKLFINEWMASNNSTIKDEYGDYADWFEIYNGDINPVSLSTIYATDKFLEPLKWKLPDITMAPGQFLLFWADNTPSNGTYHTNFKLSASGEEIGLYSSSESGARIIDTLSFGPQTTDVSEGCYPDGVKPYRYFTKAEATPGYSNVTGSTGVKSVVESASFSLNVFPNPAIGDINITLSAGNDCSLQFTLVNILGQEISLNTAANFKRGQTTLHFSSENFKAAPGIYLLKATGYSINSEQFIQLEKNILILK